MEKRGGGIKSLELVDMNNKIDSYYQIFVKFTTIDSMGANFINTCLEKITEVFRSYIEEKNFLNKTDEKIDFVMSILSNYVPKCIVKASVSCPIRSLESESNMTKKEFCDKFIKAVKIAEIDPHRAVTNNKGIMNGIDAVSYTHLTLPTKA